MKETSNDYEEFYSGNNYNVCCFITELARYLSYELDGEDEMKHCILKMSFKVAEDLVKSAEVSKYIKKFEIYLMALNIVFNDKTLGSAEAMLIYHLCLATTEIYKKNTRNFQ
ncbi:hypothetical protein [Vreelandella arcis]|uniref:Uncharacterized protein n=1 Tax=Vreelandella arcis TaxID=416873 RepID=A0A1H0CYE5_9GAMM|nr:hypothetical protein [Halomonas arcis]SDN62816.1 hypothetical protein SAMN04487951_106242 [Halomonas arcis]